MRKLDIQFLKMDVYGGGIKPSKQISTIRELHTILLLGIALIA